MKDLGAYIWNEEQYVPYKSLFVQFVVHHTKSFEGCGKYENEDYQDVKNNLELFCIYLDCEFKSLELEHKCFVVMQNKILSDYLTLKNTDNDSIRVLIIEVNKATRESWLSYTKVKRFAAKLMSMKIGLRKAIDRCHGESI